MTSYVTYDMFECHRQCVTVVILATSMFCCRHLFCRTTYVLEIIIWIIKRNLFIELKLMHQCF